MRLFTGGDQARNKGTLRQLVLALGILLFLLAQKEFVQGLTSGATKG